MFTNSEQLTRMLLLIFLRSNFQTVVGSKTSQLFHLSFEMSFDDLQFEIIFSRSTRVTATSRIFSRFEPRLNTFENKLSIVNAEKNLK